MKRTSKSIPLFFFLIILLHSCSSSVDKIKNRTWEGQMYRTSDDKVLAETVKLKITNDTLFIFSNAILGADNDTLFLSSFNKTDSVYTYKNPNGESVHFRMNYETEKELESLYVFSNDFYMVLGISNSELFSPGALSFYHNISVPRNAYMYLDGSYEGELEFENQLTNLFSMFSMGPIKVKFVFSDGFKVKVFGSTLWGNSSELQPYTVKGDKIFLGNKGEASEGFRVVDNGQKLVGQSDRVNIILYKKY